MHSKKVISALMTLGLLASTMINSNALCENSNEVAKTSIENSTNTNTYYNFGGPSDVSVANEEKIIEMLIKEGKISKNATQEEVNKVYQEYIKNTSDQNKNEKLTKQQKELKAKEAKNNKQKSLNEESEVNMLVLLAEFDDYKHNSIESGESDLWYETFEKEHYEQMFFGEDGFKGPNGEDLKSVRQFYNEQSGGTMKINGGVTDWVKVPNTAKYYGESVGGTNDIRARDFIKDALDALAEQDPNFDFSAYDKIDRYDSDGDGNYNEPDGIIDNLMVIHAGLGEDEGGGSLGSDAIWSHRWNTGNIHEIKGTEYRAYDYTTVGENAAIGVVSHELAHDLGLPDEYDTGGGNPYGEPIGYWSLMASGSWAGKIPGSQPSGISPYGREIMQAKYGGNWQKQTVINYEDLNSKGVNVDLKEASKTGQTIKVNLPDLETEIVKPTSGEKAYWGGKPTGDGYSHITSMNANIDLTNTQDPTLKFKAWYDIEEDWDFASIQVKEEGSENWNYVRGNISTDKETGDIVVDIPDKVGITGNSNGWVDAEFSLKEYAGKNIELKINYETDLYTAGAGIYVDDVALVDGENILLSDDAEGESKFELKGFESNNGKMYSENYYLIEWRGNNGVDEGLANIATWYGDTYKYDPGMVIWYVNNFYSENWTNVHPGGGYLSVVDADQTNIPYNYRDSKEVARYGIGRYQMHDAAFSSKNGSKFELDIRSGGKDVTAVDKFSSANPKFSDKKDFTNSQIQQLGTNLPKLGLELKIEKQAKDNTGATINISKK